MEETGNCEDVEMSTLVDDAQSFAEQRKVIQ
jgi:hypothetical protein